VYQRRITNEAVTRALAAAAIAGGGLAACSAALLLAATGPAVAAQSPAPLSVPVSYSCDFSSYQPGAAPLTVSSTMNAPATVTAGAPLTVTLSTSGTAIPAATAADLPAMSYLGLTGVATTSGAATMDDSLAGRSDYLGGAAQQMTEIPPLTGTGTVTPPAAGTLSVTAPSSIRLVPTGTSGTLAPVTCTTTSAVQVQVAVVADLAGTAASTPGGTMVAQPAGTQAYACATPGTAANGGTPTTSMVPMRLSSAGPDSMAADDQVSLTSATTWKPMAGATPATAAAALGLEGASGGSIPLTASMHGGDLALTGTWQPTKTGLFRLIAPHRFHVTMRTTTTVTVVVVCTATTVTTTTATVRVAASTTGTATSETSTTSNSMAPATGAGGSLHSPVDLSLLAGGILAAGAGVVTILLTIRRRGRALLP
jgi:hypothetical protein